MRTLNEKVAIVVGAADGIGRATAKGLARQGARVVLAYHSNLKGAEIGVEEIRDEGGVAQAFKVDYTDEGQVKELMQATIHSYGAIHVLINNATINNVEQLSKDRDVVNMDGEYWDLSMRVNLKGPMLTCKHAIPHMVKAGYGSIVNTGSGVVFRGDSVRTGYAAAKSGLHSLTMNIATQYGKQNVRCNVVSPGLVLTNLVREYLTPEQIAKLTAENLVPFIGEPEDLANVSVFLASPQSRYITGQLIAVDGGLHVHQSILIMGMG
jgi:NAD(P)-dependent dehydrogenase (short-subunit alcohol dehydrogenase family)